MYAILVFKVSIDSFAVCWLFIKSVSAEIMMDKVGIVLSSFLIITFIREKNNNNKRMVFCPDVWNTFS